MTARPRLRISLRLTLAALVLAGGARAAETATGADAMKPAEPRRATVGASIAVVPRTAPSTQFASPQFDYRLEPRRIADGVFVLVGRTEDFSTTNGGNIVNTGFIVGPSGVIVIDTGPSRRYGEQMLAAIRRVTDRPVVLTVNTHHHPDHFLGNQAFPVDSIAALAETRRGIETDGEAFSTNLYRMAGDWMAGTEAIAPSRTITAGRTSVGGRDLEFVALDGHTGADLVVVDHASGTVFAGDLLFHGRAPTTPHAEPTRWLAALDRLEALPARRWVPGHGEVSEDASSIRETRAYLHWLVTAIRDGAEAGLDITEMLAQPIPTRFRALAEVDREYRRSLIHLFPRAEQAALEVRDER